MLILVWVFTIQCSAGTKRRTWDDMVILEELASPCTPPARTKEFGISHVTDDFTRGWKLGSGLCSAIHCGNEEKDMQWHGCSEELAPAFSLPARIREMLKGLKFRIVLMLLPEGANPDRRASIAC